MMTTSKINAKRSVRDTKAAFKTNMGLFEPTVMPFGLRNALAVFQRMMNTQFADITATGKVIIYMDDIRVGRMLVKRLPRQGRVE